MQTLMRNMVLQWYKYVNVVKEALELYEKAFIRTNIVYMYIHVILKANNINHIPLSASQSKKYLQEEGLPDARNLKSN